MAAALTMSHDTVIIEDETRDEAIEVLRGTGDATPDGFSIMIDGEEHRLPESINQLIMHVLEGAAKGGAVTVRTMPEELTTTVAADLIGVSRPTLMKLIANGEIGARDVGSHKRLKAREVIEFRDRKLARQRDAFAELRSLNV